MLEWRKEKFRRMFPNLFNELEGDKIPTILDHLEICEDEKEALEIIEYFERREEITPEYASFLKANIDKLKFLFKTRKRGDYTRRGLVD